MQHNSPVGILLAAGYGRRFDPTGSRNKLTQKLGNGTLVAVQSAQNMRQVLSRVFAVVQSPELASTFTLLGSKALLFPGAEHGMGASLAFAVADVVKHEPDAESVIIALADMPYVQFDTIQKIAAALLAGADIVQPVFQQLTGHPVGFSKRHFAALMALNDDIGARHLLLEFPVTQIIVNDPGIVQDIDFITDLPG